MKKNYFPGLIGALFGGLIATIPWVLVYVYANMMYSILAIFVAMGALKGYQLFKGKIDKKLPTFITIISLISISLSTLIIIPCLLLARESVAVNPSNLKLLYADTEFVAAILKDYVITILFTFLGISGVITSIKKQTEENEELEHIKIDLSNGNSKKDRKKAKDLFLSKNATAVSSAIDIEDQEINKNTLNILITQKIIVKTEEDKYYYNEEAEKTIAKKTKKTLIIIFLILFILFGFIIYLDTKNNQEEKLENDAKQEEKRGIVYTIPNGYNEYADDEYENSWFYVPSTDLSGYSGYIDVYEIDNFVTYSEEWVEKVKNNLESYEGKVQSVNDYKNGKGNTIVAFDVKFSEYAEMVYYIIGADKTAIVEVIDYGKHDTIQKDGKQIADSLTWQDNTQNKV